MKTAYQDILTLLDEYDPKDYARTRNYIDGAVSRLSPYISRGVISTHQVAWKLFNKGFSLDQIEKFYQELAWRDYWQRIWLDDPQRLTQDDTYASSCQHIGLSDAITNAQTEISGIDSGIQTLYETGYVHNHVRMYIASLHCNIAKRDWLSGARWMYYHLIDADWASNALSWKWTSGQFNGKRYYANQDNVNKFCRTEDSGTCIDRSYEYLNTMSVPEFLNESVQKDFRTILPDMASIELDPNKPTALYTIYNLDPVWRADIEMNRVLILEPSHFEEYPVSDKTIDFVLHLAKNIDGIKIYAGEFNELSERYESMQFYFKEHPFNTNFKGIEDQRHWLAPQVEVKGSFFNYWKQVKKNLKQEFGKSSKHSLVEA